MSSYIFNPNDWNSSTVTEDMIAEIRADLDPVYLNSDGDTMFGTLVGSTINANTGIYTPSLDIGTQMSFPDNSVQTTGFTNEIKTDIDNTVEKTQYMSITNSKTKLSSDLVFNDTSIQTTGFTDTIKSNLQNIIYDTNTLKTTIGNNCLINNLTCNNINTSHLMGTSSNIQSQINTLANASGSSTSLTNISYDDTLQTTSIGGYTYIDNLTMGNLNKEHLNATDGNLQTQINLINTNISNMQYTVNDLTDSPSTFIDMPLILKNATADTDIETSGQNDYEPMQFHNAMTIQPISTHRTFYLGSLCDVTDGATVQFCVGANGGGAPDPNILMSLSNTAVYFFGVKHPLVPVGAIQMFAGTSSPTGYLMCQGQSVSKTTYNLLFAIIGNTYLNGRTASSTNFYLPDLRGMFVRGAGSNSTYTGTSLLYPIAGGSNGEFQKHQTMEHSHTYQVPYTSRTVVKTVTTGEIGTTNETVWNDTTTDALTTEITQPSSTTTTYETRPYNISMNYIIKF